MGRGANIEMLRIWITLAAASPSQPLKTHQGVSAKTHGDDIHGYTVATWGQNHSKVISHQVSRSKDTHIPLTVIHNAWELTGAHTQTHTHTQTQNESPPQRSQLRQYIFTLQQRLFVCLSTSQL